MPIYRATSQNPTTIIANQPAGNLAASLLDSMNQTIWNVLNDSSNGFATLATDTGVVNQYVLSNNSPCLSYRQGMLQAFFTANANTGPAQINVDGLGNVSITTSAGVALSGGELSATSVNMLIYDGTKFRQILPALGPAALLPLMVGWAAYTGSLAATPTLSSVTNWVQTGTKGLAITLDSANTNFTVPGCSVIQLTITTPADLQVYQVSLGNTSGITFGAVTINNASRGGSPVASSAALAGFQTAGTFFVQGFSNGSGTLPMSLGILTMGI